MLPRGEPVWTQVLVDVLGQLGVEQKSARQALKGCSPRTARAAECAGPCPSRAIGCCPTAPCAASSFVGPFGDTGQQRAMVAQAWDIAEVEAAYVEFLASFSDAAPADPADLFTHQILRVHAWRRFPFLDPKLPSELLPARWAGSRAAELFDTLHGRWQRPARRYWQKLSG